MTSLLTTTIDGCDVVYALGSYIPSARFRRCADKNVKVGYEVTLHHLCYSLQEFLSICVLPKASTLVDTPAYITWREFNILIMR
jgi:hypothetical protein